MNNYSGINLPLSACIHFIRNSTISDSLSLLTAVSKETGFLTSYVDFLDVSTAKRGIINVIGDSLRLENRPYDSGAWVRFTDDFITLSYKYSGVVLVIDNTDIFLERDRNGVFDLIEAFLLQFHHWYDQKKPCHLCFQMEKNHEVADVLMTRSR